MISLLAKADPTDQGLAVIFIAAGIYAVIAAWRNWSWFFAFRITAMFVVILGRKGARILYAVLGCFLIACGILIIR